MRRGASLWVLVLFLVRPAIAQQNAAGPLSDWEVRPGFSLQIDTDGFHFPTAIAFVPRPGGSPKDPLYFVTELRGRVKVVTNDRTVLTFADGLSAANPVNELPDDAGEHGVAGLCLDPAHGYVFVTVAFEDSSGVLRNNIVRFETKPGTFSTEPAAQTSFAYIFADFPSTYSHQIGPCEVVGETLFVSAGDAHESVQAQYPGSPMGKILRMTLDGRPLRDNPMYRNDDVKTPQNYIWAMGFRNPFSLEPLGGRLFVADNGINADRFIEIERGQNYGWDGTDRSLTTNALVVFAPAASPVSLQYYPPGSEVFPVAYRDRFYITLAGKIVAPGAGRFGERSIMTLDYDAGARKMRGPPSLFVRFRGSGNQVPVGMAFGPDGLYFASILPAESGTSAIYKVVHDPGAEHAFLIGRTNDARTLMADNQCLGCHSIGGRGGQVGPALDAADLVARLDARLNAPEYAASVAAVDSLTLEPYTQYVAARQEVLAASGAERVRVWLRHRLIEPRFDSPASAMPRPDLTDAQARVLADYLMQPPETAPASGSGSFVSRLRQAVPPSRYRYTVIAFIAGFVLAVLIARWIWRTRTA